MQAQEPRQRRFNWGTILLIAFGLGVIYEVFVPSVVSAERSSAVARETTYVKAANLAMLDYVNNHGDQYPNLSGDMTATLAPYIKDADVLKHVKGLVWYADLSGKEPDHGYGRQHWLVYAPNDGLSRVSVGWEDGHCTEVPTGHFFGVVLKRGTPDD